MKIGISCYPVYGGSGVVATELGIELAQTQTPGEERYRCVHKWIEARRAQQKDDELAMRNGRLYVDGILCEREGPGTGSITSLRFLAWRSVISSAVINASNIIMRDDVHMGEQAERRDREEDDHDDQTDLEWLGHSVSYPRGTPPGAAAAWFPEKSTKTGCIAKRMPCEPT